MRKLLISIIIPVYNVENYLKKCIDSILNQTYKYLDVILVDDGSTDKSGEICDEYSQMDDRITVIHKGNAGVSAARNDGIALAKGDYICFVDSDDWLAIDYIEIVSSILEEQKPSVLINNWTKVDINGECHNSFNNEETITLDNHEAVLQLIKNDYYDWSPFASFYYANECKECYFDKSITFGEDLLFKYCFIKKANSKIIYQPLSKYYYVFRESSAVNSYPLRKKIDDIKVYEHIILNENNEIGELFYKKMYLPQLVKYSVIAFFSKFNEDKIIGKEINQKIIENLKANNLIFFLLLYTRKIAAYMLPQKLREYVLNILNI